MKIIKQKNYLFIVLLFCITPLMTFGQNMDSLKLVLKNAKHDTTRVNILLAMAEGESLSLDSVILVCENALTIIENNITISKNRMLSFYQLKQSEALNNIGQVNINFGDYKKSLEYLEKSLKIKKKINDSIGITAVLHNIGSAWFRAGNSDEALKYHFENLKHETKLNDKAGVASTLNSIGAIFMDLGNTSKALEYYFKSLKIQDSLNSKKDMANILNNIASIFSDNENYENAIIYYERSLKILDEIGNKFRKGYVLNNIADMLSNQKKYLKSLNYYQRSLAIFKEFNNKDKISTIYNNIGNVYKDLKEIDTAIVYYNTSLKIAEQIKDDKQIALALNSIGNIYLYKKDYYKAEKNSIKALLKFKTLGFPKLIAESSKLLYQIYSAQGNYKEAFKMHVLFKQMSDSINNQETRKSTVKKQMQYEFGKKESETKAEQDKKDAITLKEKQKQTIITYAIALGLLIALGFGVFIYRSYKQKQKANVIITQQKQLVEKQKEEVEHQKHIIEEAQKEISDSINYAKRIQSSFMASKQELDVRLNNYFVLFKPKDIVSGDFYWANTSGNYFYLCTADSTGHGIPGAFMSLLNISLLNEGLFSRNLTNTADILNFVRKILILGVKADESGQGGKDGMDCSLMRLDFENNILAYSAANNPIWIVRTVTSSNDEGVYREAASENSSRHENLKEAEFSTRTNIELIELKPDKMPVGKHDRQDVPFTQHEIQLQKGDVIYTLTDGFPDQFGGPKGKKFMSKNLRELLHANAHLSMSEQKELLENTFKNWVGEAEQIDDVTLIGIRI